MAYTPLTEEEYNKAINSGFTHDQIVDFEKQRMAEETPPDSIATKGPGYVQQHPVLSLLQGLPQTITGKSMEQRAVESTQNPSFGQSATAPFDKNVPNSGNIALGQLIGGQAVDIATSPSTYLAGPILKGTGQVLGKSAVFIGNVLNKAKASYITDEVAPKAFNVFKNNVEKFTSEIENYAKVDLNVPEEAVKNIKQIGVKNIDAISAQYGKSTDPIYQKIQQGIAKKSKEVEDAYSKSFSNLVEGQVIHVDKTKRAMGAMLKEYGYLNEKGRETTLALNDTIENSPLKRMLGFYKAIDPKKSEGLLALNGSQWNLFRNNLSKLSRQDKSLSKPITGVLDALHADAEKAGLKGISEARSLARANFQAEDNILNSALIKERKLDNYFKLSGEEKRQLKSIEDFTRTPFINDLKNVTSGKYLDNIREGKTLDNFVNDLHAASDRSKTNYIMHKYSKVLGIENAQKIFKEVITNRQLGVAKKTIGWTTGTAVGLKTADEIRKRIFN